MILDSLYMFIFIVSLVLSIGAQIWVSSSYRKWSKVKNSSGLKGSEIGPLLSAKNNLDDVKFGVVKGEMTDFYDPTKHLVKMSQGTAEKDTVASMAIVAHELGHALQHKEKSALIQVRSFLVPALKVSPQISFVLIFAGLFFNLTGLFQLGIIFYGLVVLFAFVTLPVEFDASKRGILMLKQAGYFQNPQDEQGSKAVLYAAAGTYIAAAITSLLQLLYYISISRR